MAPVSAVPHSALTAPLQQQQKKQQQRVLELGAVYCCRISGFSRRSSPIYVEFPPHSDGSLDTAMTSMQSLSVFVTERLTLAAQEIFKAVEVTVSEYHQEISRSRQENELLKRRLLEAGIDLYPELQPNMPSMPIMHDGDGDAGQGPPACGQQWGQTSEEIQVKLELSAAQERLQDAPSQIAVANEPVSPKPCLQSEQKMEDMFQSQTAETSMDNLLLAGPYVQVKQEPNELVSNLGPQTLCDVQSCIPSYPNDAAAASGHTSGLGGEMDSQRMSSMHKPGRSKIMVGKRKIKKANSAPHPVKKRSKGQLTVKPFQWNRRMSPEEEEDKEEERSRGAYKVLGRLTVQKKHYWVKRDEVERRVKGENMSTNVFRSLLRVARKDLPKDVLNQPKSAKTRVSVFSALTEGEAQDLAEGFGAALMRHVPRYHLLDGIHDVDIAASHRTIQRIRTNFQSLGLESDFDLTTHRFGPTAVEIFMSFLEETLQSTLGFMPYI